MLEQLQEGLPELIPQVSRGSWKHHLEHTGVFVSHGNSSVLLLGREKCMKPHCAARRAWKTAFSAGRGSTFELQCPVNVYSEIQWIKINFFCTGDHLDCFKKTQTQQTNKKTPCKAFQGCLTILAVLSVSSSQTWPDLLGTSFNVLQHLKLILLKNPVP